MKNKLYRASITLPNGKRKWVRSVSQEGLEQKKQELLTQIGAGLDVSNNSTFGEYARSGFASIRCRIFGKTLCLLLKTR